MSAYDHLFPLPLSDFEYYSFFDETRAYPMVFPLRAVIDGNLDVEALRASICDALEENPLLRAVIRGTYRPRWHLMKDHEPRITCQTFQAEKAPRECEEKFLDLSTESGVCFEIRAGRSQSVLACWFHHSCVDGIGAIRFLADVFAHYGKRTAEAAGVEVPTDRTSIPETIRLRGSRTAPGDQADRNAPLTQKFTEAYRLFCRSCYRMKGRRGRNDRSGSMFHTVVLKRRTVRGLKKLAGVHGTSTNDLCMLAYVQELEHWSRKDPDADPRDLLRILMPVSMRTPDHDGICSVNVVSFVFHYNTRQDCLNPSKQLKEIHRRTQEMINRNEGATMLQGFTVARLIPGMFRMSQKLQPAFATAVLANVGEVKRMFDNRFPLSKGRIVAGNVVVHCIDGVAPLRRNTNVSVSFGSYGGEMTINLRACPELFSGDEARELLEQFRRRLNYMGEFETLDVPESAVELSSDDSEAVDVGRTETDQARLQRPDPATSRA